MDPEIIEHVKKRSKGRCEVCGSANMVELHHIIGGSGKRKQHETKESVVALCFYHHRGTYGVHGREGRALDLKLKRQLQEKYRQQGYTEEEVRRKMGGKIY